MRRTVIGLAVAAVFVLGACGGDDDDSSSDAAESESSGEVSASSPEAERFCNDFLDLTQSGAAGSSPEAAVEALRGLEPPEEIADAFALTIEGTELQAQMAAEGDGQPDPELQAEFDERSEEFQQANMQVQEFLATECNLGPAPSESEGDSGGEDAGG
ncbi:MAG TPA: hypothetical protein VIL48_05600 [Acidimicrobiales bacterium]